MSLKFLRPLTGRPTSNSAIKATPGLSPLQKITQAYREKQASNLATTNQQIGKLSQDRLKLSVAATVATQKDQKPLDNYLNRSGEMVERRIANLQAKINGQTQSDS
ncbi:MAG TPA: hypothetical protein DEP87_01045 [Candidatus Pacebacteria bacterium]|nr:hypothetical protein [Candidatus Paceibacterota bacterium]